MNSFPPLQKCAPWCWSFSDIPMKRIEVCGHNMTKCDEGYRYFSTALCVYIVFLALF